MVKLFVDRFTIPFTSNLLPQAHQQAGGGNNTTACVCDTMLAWVCWHSGVIINETVNSIAKKPLLLSNFFALPFRGQKGKSEKKENKLLNVSVSYDGEQFHNVELPRHSWRKIIKWISAKELTTLLQAATG